MLIRDRIFNKLEELKMTQKEFSEKTGIPQSTISDWRKKRTNPTAEKIMIIRSNPQKWFAIDADTALGKLVMEYNRMDAGMQERLLGYAEALGEAARIRNEI